MPSGNRGLSLVLAAIVAYLTLGQVHLPVPVPAPVIGQASEEKSESSEARRSPSKTREPANAQPEVERDGASGQTQEPAAEATCAEGETLLREYAALYQPGLKLDAFDFVVALVPDPEESALTSYFDAIVDGIDDAAAAVNYTRDRHHFPWPSGDRATAEERCFERAPGVIVYRPSDSPGARRALAVLLVGEAPTWGVRGRAFAKAAALAERSGPIGRADDGWVRTVHVLGPTFSGSAPSLASALSAHVRVRRADPAGRGPLPFHFVVRSGTATSDDLRTVLESVALHGDVEISYGSAQPGNTELETAMLGFLVATRGTNQNPLGSTVIFSESKSGYGDSVASSERTGHRPRVIRFPANLSSMRRAFDESESADAKVPLTRPSTRVRAKPAEARGELSEQTPILHDLELTEVLRRLGHDRVRNVGIIATDALDVVFMAKRIKLLLPDVRLFTFDFDNRYLHPDHARYVNGMLVAHGVVAARDVPSTALHSPMTLGVSTALSQLLGRKSPAPKAHVSLVGNGVLWPMAGRRHEIAPPRSFGIAQVVALVAFALVALLVSLPRVVLFLAGAGSRWPGAQLFRRAQVARKRGALWAAYGELEHADLAAEDAFATAALVTVVLSVPLMLTASALSLHVSRVSLWLTLLAALLVLGLVWRRAQRHIVAVRGVTEKQRTRPRVTEPLLFGLLVAGVAAMATSLGCAPPREATFSLLSGASPLIGGLLGLALLFVVVECWRRRIRLLDTLCFGRKPPQSDPPEPALFTDLKLPIAAALELGNDSEVGLLERHLQRVVRSPWRQAPLLPFAILVLFGASLAIVLVGKPPITFEVGWRHLVLVAFVSACIAPIVNGFARILVTSRALLRLLQAVARDPVLGAFRRLPKPLARRLETQLVGGSRDVSDLVHVVNALKKLSLEQPSLADAARDASAALAAELAYASNGDRELSEDRRVEHGPAYLAHDLLDVAGRLSAHASGAGPKLARAIADFRGCLVAMFVGRYVRLLRHLAPPVVFGSTIAVLMTLLYFVQPQRLISSVCFVWIAAMALGIVITYAALSRDAVISAIGGTTAGSVSPNFALIGRAVALAAVPFLSLMASQYPDLAYWLSALLGGFARALQ